jgi:AraC-like DNA-binding protein
MVAGGTPRDDDSRCCHVVRHLFGTTFVQLVTDKRLRTAVTLLRNTDLPVLEVAHRSGFADVSTFHRVFRRRFGITPRTYRTHGGT